MRISFIGLGLIGGSVALALRAGPSSFHGVRLAAWSPRGAGPSRALAAGAIDEAPGDLDAALAGADLVVLAAPPLACVELLGRIGLRRGLLAPGATVTDVASTKAAVTAAAASAGVPFAGGHPMAGREHSGFDAADAALFKGRPWVVTEAVAGGDQETVRRLAAACGAVPVDLESMRHDGLVAAISHLPLLTSVALVETVAGTGPEPAADWAAAAALAATGWRDTTRLARGDPAMGAEIAATNAPAIAHLLRAYRDRIDTWIEALEAPGGPSAEALRTELEAARDRLQGER